MLMYPVAPVVVRFPMPWVCQSPDHGIERSGLEVCGFYKMQGYIYIYIRGDKGFRG